MSGYDCQWISVRVLVLGGLSLIMVSYIYNVSIILKHLQLNPYIKLRLELGIYPVSSALRSKSKTLNRKKKIN